MENNELEILRTNPESILKEIEDAFWDIPFGQSNFQTENFVIANNITPERAYRSIGLALHSKLSALSGMDLDRKKQDITISELKHKIENTEASIFDKQRWQLDIDTILSSRVWQEKLKLDAIIELGLLYKHFKALPRYTREEFEAAEHQYYQQNLQRKVRGIEGAVEALINMNEDTKALEKFEEALKELPPAEARMVLSNIIPIEKNKEESK